MRDLARAYGCQPANLYNHFKTKESILFEVLLEEMEQIIRPISHLKDEDRWRPFIAAASHHLLSSQDYS